jgi:predicted signal transduction protein with EAL and GGDEF domain
VVVKPSLTIGISIHPDNGGDMDTLLQRADMALHQAKADGRGDFRFFSETMNQHAQAHLALEAALRDALQNESLELHYQPQVRLRDGRLHGVEALARWRHPVLGTIPPVRFIPLAEECGMIAALGHWALRTACRQLAAWRRAGLDVPTVSVNLSPTCFHDPKLAETVAALIRESGLKACELTIEITEEVLLDSHPETLRTLAELKTCGMRLSMDDFGTGYSSLSHLRKLPERAQARQELRRRHRQRPRRARTDAGGDAHRRKPGPDVVAEASRMPAIGSAGRRLPRVQGYFYSPALTAAELERWLRERTPTPAGIA